MTNTPPTTYVELAQVLANLPLLLREALRARQVTARAASREIGCAYATVKRVEGGQLPNGHTALLILRWLGGAS